MGSTSDYSSEPKFLLQDFSLIEHSSFWDAYKNLLSQNESNEVESINFPTISISFIFEYSDRDYELKGLSELIIDLNSDCHSAIAKIEYYFDKQKIENFLLDIDKRNKKTNEELDINSFLLILSDILSDYYKTKIYVQDPVDKSNTKKLNWSTLQKVISCNFIGAQRAIDDNSRSDRATLSKIVEGIFSSANSELAKENEKEIVDRLVSAVADVQDQLNDQFNTQFSELVPALKSFGYPGLVDPAITTQTKLDVEQLMTNNTSVGYEIIGGIVLPESYNGLGPRNLIFIILKLYEFYKYFITSQPTPITHLIFIEEPEAHLHPQMQTVFINQINKIKAEFSRENGELTWPVQFIITTHSSYVANDAPFHSIRYFLAKPCSEGSPICSTDIKDLCKGLGSDRGEDIEFLHKYMTLTKCDLFFADKAILIEGTAERLMLPKIMEKIDSQNEGIEKLQSQYISIIEVGGAYAHIFFSLLDFLNLRTVIITDIDSANRHDNNKKCLVSKGTHSSNQCINTWFAEKNGTKDTITINEILNKEDNEKVKSKRRIAYQIPEKDSVFCGRSFEDAFILANLDEFGFEGIDENEIEQAVWDEVNKINKTAFAIKYAISNTNWTVPRYISEGLIWLAFND